VCHGSEAQLNGFVELNSTTQQDLAPTAPILLSGIGWKLGASVALRKVVVVIPEGALGHGEE
jgi:hypothetical protein